MKLLTLVLIASTLSATSARAEVLDPPVIESLPEGLPQPIDVEGGVLIPHDLAEALDKEREQALACPETCKNLLKFQYGLGLIDMELALKKQKANLNAVHAKELADVESKGFSLWEVLGITGGAVAATAITVALAFVLGGDHD